MHVVEIFSLPVHGVLQVEAGADGAVQLLEVLAGVAHVPHSGAVDHGGLGDLGQNLFLRLALENKAEVDALPGLH